MTTFTVQLNSPAHEMAREEIRKQVAFLSKDLQNVRFSEQGDRIDFDAPEAAGAPLVAAGARVGRRMPHMSMPPFTPQT